MSSWAAPPYPHDAGDTAREDQVCPARLADCPRSGRCRSLIESFMPLRTPVALPRGREHQWQDMTWVTGSLMPARRWWSFTRQTTGRWPGSPYRTQSVLAGCCAGPAAPRILSCSSPSPRRVPGSRRSAQRRPSAAAARCGRTACPTPW